MERERTRDVERDKQVRVSLQVIANACVSRLEWILVGLNEMAGEFTAGEAAGFSDT